MNFRGENVMNIGVDADGVLTDMQAFNFQYGKKFFKKAVSNPSGYSVKEIFDVNKKMELLYGLIYFPKYCKNCLPQKDASDILGKLKAEGHAIHEITARKFVKQKGLIGQCSRRWFENWCDDNGFYFTDITYCSEKNGPEEKYRACINLDIDVMIDDRPEIVLYLAARGIKVYMMDALYNQNINNEKIIRVHSWKEIYKKLLNYDCDYGCEANNESVTKV